MGIGYVPEDMGVFANLTIEENMRVAMLGDDESTAQRLERVLDMFADLQKFWNTKAGNLSGGQKQMLAIARAIVAAMAVVGLLGIILERIIIRRVYGFHLFQILITFGATIVLVELIRVFWGPNDEVMPVPLTFQGNWDIMDVIILRYPVLCIVIGLIVYSLIQLLLKRTKLGTIVRAGVENRDMVQAMGHNIFLYFTGVFMAGAGLAALGGLAMAIFSLQVYPDMGSTYLLYFPGHLCYLRMYHGQYCWRAVRHVGWICEPGILLGGFDDYAGCPSYGYHRRNGNALRGNCGCGLFEDDTDFPARSSETDKRPFPTC